MPSLAHGLLTIPVWIVSDGMQVRGAPTTNRVEARARCRVANALLHPDAIPFTVQRCRATVTLPAGLTHRRFVSG
jgi:hypothetical protein